MESFYQHVLEPAAKGAIMIHTSVSTYRYSITEHPLDFGVPLNLGHLEMHKMLDVKNGNYLKPNAAFIADRQGVIGKFSIPLKPGLYRTKEGKDETTLRPMTCWVEFKYPVAKGNQSSTYRFA